MTAGASCKSKRTLRNAGHGTKPMTDRLPHEKGFHVSWDQLHRDARALAWRLDGRGPLDGGWKAVVAITRGGMAPAMIVSRELDIRIVDTISIKSYNHQTQSQPRIIKMPDKELVGNGEGILVIDDLVDTGRTIESVRTVVPKAHVATVYAKPQGEPAVDTFITGVKPGHLDIPSLGHGAAIH